MGRYVEIGAVKTWYDEQGEGEPLVLLHGGMITTQHGAQMPDFSAQFRIIAPERRGHGHTPDLDGPLSYDVMSADTIGFMDGSSVARRIWWMERRRHRRIASRHGPPRLGAQAHRDRYELRHLGPDARGDGGIHDIVGG